MKAQKSVLHSFTALVIALLLSISVSARGDQLVNPSFETGDLSGWTVQIPQDACHAFIGVTGGSGWDAISWWAGAIDGSRCAVLKAGCPGSYTSLSQTFTAKAGDTISGWASYMGDGLPGQVLIRSGGDDGPVITTVFGASAENVVLPWTHWGYTFTTPGTYTVQARVSQTGSDSLMAVDGFSLGSNQPPVVGAITAPVDPIPLNTTVNVSANFTDPDAQDTHTATWDWGHGNASPGTVNETNGSGSVSGSYTYTAPGVYKVTLTVTDNSGASGTSVFRFIVVFDPNAGFVTGGGWINSPVGAYASNPSLTGKANFGFVSKYEQGATVPTGQTQFNFQVASLNFNSTVYEWLTVSGAKAQYKGSGTINNDGDYGFILTATDGQISGGGGVDKFRIKIWDKATGGVVYDNQMGASDNTDPTTAIGGGSIVIHKDGAAKPAISEQADGLPDAALPEVFGLDPNYPNPFNPATTIRYALPEASDVRLTIYNVLGQQVRVLVQGRQEAGYYQVTWDGKDDSGRVVSSGIYLYRFVSKGLVQTQKMLLLK